jgi:hypothetical protein
MGEPALPVFDPDAGRRALVISAWILLIRLIAFILSARIPNGAWPARSFAIHDG